MTDETNVNEIMEAYEPEMIGKPVVDNEEKLSEREAAVLKRELTMEAKERFMMNGLPPELTDCLVYSDRESYEKSRNAVESAFSKLTEPKIRKRYTYDAPLFSRPEAADPFLAGLKGKMD